MGPAVGLLQRVGVLRRAPRALRLRRVEDGRPPPREGRARVPDPRGGRPPAVPRVLLAPSATARPGAFRAPLHGSRLSRRPRGGAEARDGGPPPPGARARRVRLRGPHGLRGRLRLGPHEHDLQVPLRDLAPLLPGGGARVGDVPGLEEAAPGASRSSSRAAPPCSRPSPRSPASCGSTAAAGRRARSTARPISRSRTPATAARSSGSTRTCAACPFSSRRRARRTRNSRASRCTRACRRSRAGSTTRSSAATARPRPTAASRTSRPPTPRPDEAVVKRILRRYHVALVAVGNLERRTYAGGNLARFESWTDLLTPVYRNPEIVLFAVKGVFAPGAAAAPVRVEELPLSPREEQAPSARRRPPAACASPAERHRTRPGASGSRTSETSGSSSSARTARPSLAFGARGSGPGQFNDPCGIAVGPSGLVFVADTWNGRVQVFDDKGVWLREWGGGFFGPRGIAVDPGGTVFVADTGNGRVVRFDASGTRRPSGGRRQAPASSPTRRASSPGKDGKRLRRRQRKRARRGLRPQRSVRARVRRGRAGGARRFPSRTSRSIPEVSSGSRCRSRARCAATRPRAVS